LPKSVFEITVTSLVVIESFLVFVVRLTTLFFCMFLRSAVFFLADVTLALRSVSTIVVIIKVITIAISTVVIVISAICEVYVLRRFDQRL
jgi:hypothetical protein